METKEEQKTDVKINTKVGFIFTFVLLFFTSIFFNV